MPWACDFQWYSVTTAAIRGRLAGRGCRRELPPCAASVAAAASEPIASDASAFWTHAAKSAQRSIRIPVAVPEEIC